MDSEIPDKIQFLSIAASIMVILFVLELIRRRRIKEEYSLLWLSTGFLFLFFSIWKDGLNYISKLVGIYYPPATLFLILLVGVFSILIHFSVVISKLTEKNKLLAQELGIYKMELDLIKKQISQHTTEKEENLIKMNK